MSPGPLLRWTALTPPAWEEPPTRLVDLRTARPSHSGTDIFSDRVPTRLRDPQQRRSPSVADAAGGLRARSHPAQSVAAPQVAGHKHDGARALGLRIAGENLDPGNSGLLTLRSSGATADARGRARQLTTAWFGSGCHRSAEVKDDAGVHLGVLDLMERVVDVLEAARLADDRGATVGVQLEGLGEIDARAHDRAGDGDAIQHGLEDRELDEVVGGKRDEHQPAVTAQAGEGLLARRR